MGCPSCGAEIPYDTRFAVLTVCEYCNTAVIFDEKAAEIAGKMSVLAKPAGPLFVGASGSLKDGTSFQVIGRVRYGYENGFWDEWYLQHEDFSTSWLTEDEKRFMHEHPMTLEVDPNALKSMSPGQNIELNNIKFSIREKGNATCEGGEGQLPFRIITGEQVPFFDLVSGEGHTATIEIEPDGVVKFFQGNPLQYNDIQVDNESYNKKDLAIENAAGAAGMRERVTYDSSRTKSIQCKHCGGTNDGVDLSADHINCVHCGQSLEVPAEAFQCPSCAAQVECFTPEAKTVCCQYCGSSVSLSSGKPSLLTKLKGDDKKRRKRFKLPLALGSKATFDNLEFTLVGYIRFKEVDDGVYISNEYLLYNKEWGYRWLVCYEGHWSIEEKLDKIPQINPRKMKSYSYKQGFTAAGKRWKFFESGSGHIDWVDGELPWVAKVGDKSKYIESIAPPEMLVCEMTKNEVEWSRYRYLEISELAAAFKKEKSSFRKPSGVGACQVNKKKAYHLSSGLICLIFAFLSFIAFFGSGGGKKVADFTIKSSEYKEESLTQAFTLEKDDAIYRADFFSPVDNSWVYLDLALVNDNEEAVLDFSSEMSYYHGYDDGHWTEGSRDDSAYFKANKGTYRLLVLGNAGHGETAVDVNRGKPVTVKIYQDVKVVHYFIIYAVFAGIFGIVFLCRPLFFEGRRWKHTIEVD